MSDLFKASVLVESACLLGEGPLWIPEDNALYWIDGEGHKLWAWTEQDGASRVSTIAPVGGLARGPDGWLVATIARGFGFIDPDTGAIVTVGDPKVCERRALMNDCKCDRKGRLVAGSRHPAERDPIGKGFILEKGSVRQILSDIVVWNGPAFSPSGDRIYYTDSLSRQIMTAPYNLADGSMGVVEVFAETKGDEGYPDGMTVDSAGRLWVACWGGWGLACYAPDGTLVQTVEIPVPQVTSITFGGPDMKTAFVTTARVRLDKEGIQQAPASGHLFTFQTDVPGLVEPEYDE